MLPKLIISLLVLIVVLGLAAGAQVAGQAWVAQQTTTSGPGTDPTHPDGVSTERLRQLRVATAKTNIGAVPGQTGTEKAETAEVRAAPGPGELIFFDGFEYEVNRDELNAKPSFITVGKWSGVKSQNAMGKGLGYLYTTNRIPGYTGPFPGRSSKRVLAIEGRPKTFNNQTDFYLQFGNPRDNKNTIPGNVWFQFWLYPNHYDDPEDHEDQLSGFGSGFKFIYPSVDGGYPTHPGWLFTLGRSSHVVLKDRAEPFFAEAAAHDLLLSVPTESGAEIAKAEPWNRWKLGQTSLDERIASNRWTLVKLHFDTSTTSGKYEAWLQPLGGKWVKVAEWIDGVTEDFSWKIPAEKVGGYRSFRMPTTIGSFGERARDNKDCWIYMDDFAMASSEDALPKYAD